MPKGDGNRLPGAKHAAIFQDWKAGGTYASIAAQHKIHLSTVARLIQKFKRGGRPPGKVITQTPMTTALALPREVPASEMRGSSKYAHLVPEIQKLKAQGFSSGDIARKLGIPPANVYYYTTRLNKGTISPQGEPSNGNGNALSTQFLVGFGCAELERTCTAISQRLGIAPQLLRQGFSKLLGSAALR